MLLRMPGNGNVPIPLIVPSDAGNFVKALTQVSPGKNLLAFGDRLTWADYVKLWSQVTGIPAAFEKTTVEEHVKLAPGGLGEEMAEMYAYAMDFGYDGGDPSIISAEQVSAERGPLNTLSSADTLSTKFEARNRYPSNKD